MILIFNKFVTKELKAQKERYENKEASNEIQKKVDKKDNIVINYKLAIHFFVVKPDCDPSARNS
jgi:hypothetical protein